MLSGITLAAKAMKPSITVVAAEPCGSNSAADVAACKTEGRLIQDMPKTLTIADGLQGELLMVIKLCVFGVSLLSVYANQCHSSSHALNPQCYTHCFCYWGSGRMTVTGCQHVL